LIFSAFFIHLAGSLIPLRTIGAFVFVAVDTVLFAMIFKYLPNASIIWRDVFVGAFVTAILFEIGKYALGVFFALSSFESAYTAAGSFLALMIWLYYSSIIFLIGAKFTHVYASTHGSGVTSAPNAGFTRRAGKQGPEEGM
jgi:membrane protein